MSPSNETCWLVAIRIMFTKSIGRLLYVIYRLFYYVRQPLSSPRHVSSIVNNMIYMRNKRNYYYFRNLIYCLLSVTAKGANFWGIVFWFIAKLFWGFLFLFMMEKTFAFNSICFSNLICTFIWVHELFYLIYYSKFLKLHSPVKKDVSGYN